MLYVPADNAVEYITVVLTVPLLLVSVVYESGPAVEEPRTRSRSPDRSGPMRPVVTVIVKETLSPGTAPAEGFAVSDVVVDVGQTLHRLYASMEPSPVT